MRRLVVLWTGLALCVVCLAAASGCPARRTGMIRSESIHDGLTRVYHLHVPEGIDTTGPRPLVVALHRFTETGPAMARMTGFNAIADREGFYVVYPDGYRRSFNFVGDERADDVGFLAALIEELAGAFAIDRERVYLTGASNGGFLAYRVACERPELFAAMAPVMSIMARAVAEGCAPARPTPLLIIHGDGDPIVPIDSTRITAGPGRSIDVLSTVETVRFWASANGCRPEPDVETLPGPVVREIYPDGREGSEVIYYRVGGGGHTWPGGVERFPGFIVGERSDALDASEAIWEFFKRHRRAPAPRVTGDN